MPETQKKKNWQLVVEGYIMWGCDGVNETLVGLHVKKSLIQKKAHEKEEGKKKWENVFHSHSSTLTHL